MTLQSSSTHMPARRFVMMLTGFMIVLMVMLPLADSVNGFLNNGGNDGGLSLGVVYRGAVIMTSLALVVLNGNKARIAFLCFSVVVLMVLPHIRDLFQVPGAASAMLKTLLPMICVEGIVAGDYKGIDQKTVLKKIMVIWSLLFPILILVPYVFGFGFSTYGSEGVGYKGYFFSQNDLCFVLVALFAVSMVGLVRANTMRVTLFFSFAACLNFTSLLMLGLKGGYLMVLAVFLICLFDGSAPKRRRVCLAAVAIIGAVIVLFFVGDTLVGILGRWEYFIGKSGSLVSFLTSGRLDRIPLIAEGLTRDNQGISWVLFGSSMTYGKYIAPYAFVEMDVVDFVFQYGIVGSFAIVSYYCQFILPKINPKDRWAELLFAIAFAMSTLAGHVLNSAMSGMVFALVCSYLYFSAKRSGDSTPSWFHRS